MNQAKIAVNVSRIEQVSPNIKMFEFVAQDGTFMPFSAGSHVTVHMGERLAYSVRIHSLVIRNTVGVIAFLFCVMKIQKVAQLLCMSSYL
ncbi:hypothetical protein AB6G58_08720 [Providencia huaxiensis]